MTKFPCSFPYPPPLKSDHIGTEDAQCAETYEKTILQVMRFSVFEIYSIKLTKLSPIVANFFFSQRMHTQCSKTYAKLIFTFLILELP